MIPPVPGTYLLFLRLSSAVEIGVGRLGWFHFRSGLYAYVGSARGPGGLVARIGRHLRRPGDAQHWHVDWLLVHARPTRVWWAAGAERRECAWARALLGMDGASVVAPGFGASDCRCPTHLVYLTVLPDRERFEQAVGSPVREVRLDG